MIRKLLMITVAVLLSFAPISAKAQTETAAIRQMGQEEKIASSYASKTLIYGGSEARLYFGEGGIDILAGSDHYHLNTDFTVLNLEILDDFNNDGYPEFITWQKTPDLSDQVIIISGKNGEVLDSLRFTYETFDNALGFTTKNSSIQKFAAVEKGYVYIVCDYSIYRYNLSEKNIDNQFTAPDNIWDIEMIWDNMLAAACQNGVIYLLDGSTLEKTSEYQLGRTLSRPADYGDFLYTATMSLWDLHYAKDGKLYVVDESGMLYAMDKSESFESGMIALMDEEELLTRLMNGRRGGWITYDYYIDDSQENNQDVSTGKMSRTYMSYVIVDENETDILIACYMGDPYCAAQENGFSGDWNYPAGLVAFRKDDFTVDATIVLENYPILNYQKPCFGKYDDQDVIFVLGDMQENVKVVLYSLTGETVAQKTLALGDVLSTRKMLSTSWTGSEYLMEIFGNSTVILSPELENKGYLFDLVEYEFFDELNGNLFFKKNVNGITRGLICYDRQMNIIWQYDYEATYRNTGISEISSGNYNKDGIQDFLLLAQHYDSKDNPLSTYFIVIDGSSGKVLLNRNLKLGTYYDEKRKKHDYYLMASSASLMRDVDKDGKAEILCDGNSFITSKSFKNNGNISEYIDTTGNILTIGDVNGDGFADKVTVTNKETRLYTSRLRYSYGSYNVEYVKTKTVRSNQEKWKNAENAVVFGDIDNDGVDEIIHFAANAKGYQVFVVTNGKTLKDMFVLCEDGVRDYFERFAIQDYDINGDGYNEILGSLNYDDLKLFDGKTGQILLEDIGEYSYGKGYYEDSYHPDYIVPFNKMETVNHVFIGADYNADGINDLVVCQQWYDEEYYESRYSLFIYSGSDLARIDEKTLDNYSYGKITPVNGKRNLLLQSDGVTTVLIDSLTGKSTASYELPVENGYYLDENHLMVFTPDLKTYILNSEMNFEITGEIPEQISENMLDLHWAGKNEFSIMTITDNDTVVYMGQDESCQIKFIEGDHVLTFKMNDGRGKTSSQTFRFHVMPQPRNTVMIAAITAVLLLLILIISLYRKIRVRRVGKAVSRHE
ncbi:MAG: VCBS repeat-containing protein [Erysipelotrichaceae bacterium]|nr:VCBS repeat-containing protein [Erysipelotrichaceae bacterium]